MKRRGKGMRRKSRGDEWMKRRMSRGVEWMKRMKSKEING